MPQGYCPQSSNPLWCCIANCDEGKIPGKVAVGADTCYYAYGGEEKQSNDFKVIRSGKFSKEPVGRAHGKQHDGEKTWCAIANTQWGRIPGKANHDTCWYPYDGEEHKTDNFWFVNKGKIEQTDSSSVDSDD